MEETWPKPAYRIDADPLWCANQKEFEKATKAVKDGGLGLSEAYIHREFPRRIYDPNGGTKLVHDEAQLATALEEGWVKEAIAPKAESIVIKGQTQAEYENQIRISKLESMVESQKEMIGEMMEVLRQKNAVQLTPEVPAARKRGRPVKVAATE